MNRLKEKYLNEVVSSLKEKHNYKSIMEVPKLEKIVINMGVGEFFIIFSMNFLKIYPKMFFLMRLRDSNKAKFGICSIISNVMPFLLL